MGSKFKPRQQKKPRNMNAPRMMEDRRQKGFSSRNHRSSVDDEDLSNLSYLDWEDDL